MKRLTVIGVCWLLWLMPGAAAADNGPNSGGEAEPHSTIRVGAKAFTESVILGEMLSLLARHAGHPSYAEELGGTRFLWSALRSGEIDIYTDYTGTIREELFPEAQLPDDQSIRQRLARENVLMSEPLGFENNYALGVRRELAERLQLTTISDLRDHPDLRMGFSNEFVDRGDGWPSLKRAYALPQATVRGMDHALTYQAIRSGDIDVMDLYTTDPQYEQYGLVVLEDDRNHFPKYRAVFLYREDLLERAPDFVQQMKRLENAIDLPTMIALNRRAEIDKHSELRVAADYLAETLDVHIEIEDKLIWDRIWLRTREHLFLVAVSMAMAIAVAVPLGVIAAKTSLWGQVIVGVAEIVQTIPGLALLVLLSVAYGKVGLPTIGELPVIMALFLYSLLPIIRNTMAGLVNVEPSLRESAAALGLAPFDRLRLIELPMASPLILAGIKTTAVINVGYAALGGLVGAGGYGQTIMTGLRRNSETLMLEGAIPAALLALLVKCVFELSERWLVPRGLRL